MFLAAQWGHQYRQPREHAAEGSSVSTNMELQVSAGEGRPGVASLGIQNQSLFVCRNTDSVARRSATRATIGRLVTHLLWSSPTEMRAAVREQRGCDGLMGCTVTMTQ